MGGNTYGMPVSDSQQARCFNRQSPMSESEHPSPVTAIDPLSLSIGIPFAAKVAEQSLGLVSQGFRAMLTKDDVQSAGQADRPGVTEQFQMMADELRQWLRQHGVRGPFSIEISVEAGERLPKVEVSGHDGQRVVSLLNAAPNLIDPLKDFVASFAEPTPLGMRASRATITEDQSSLIY
jgi:hypothetical protein